MSKYTVRIRPLAKWEFYYTQDGKEYFFSYRDCKVPTRTKDWSLLKRIKNISSYGCRLKEKRK